MNGIKGARKGAKGKNKGKSKGSSSSPGPCFRCGSPHHTYNNCSDRFSTLSATPSGSPMNGGKSKGKMYTKGKCKKGKSKHKVAYNFDYFVDVSQYEDISNENYLEKSIYVMSLHDDRTVSTQGVHMVIVDTGATELVCGANAMARIYESADLRVSLADRPTFRFGNGLSQRATSRVDLTTNALGRLSFYIWTARWREHTSSSWWTRDEGAQSN